MEYTITHVQRRDTWTSRYAGGPEPDMVDYAISLEGQSGWIKLSQKVTTPAPVEGQTINGRIGTDGKGNPKFFKETGFGGAGQANSPASPQIGEIVQKMDYAVLMLEELSGRRPSADEPGPPQDNFEDPFPGI